MKDSNFIGVSEFEYLIDINGNRLSINHDIEKISGFSCDYRGQFSNDLIAVDFIDTYQSVNIISIVLDNNQEIFLGCDQGILLRNGTVIKASEITVGSSVMPFYYAKINNDNCPGCLVKDNIDGWTSVIENVDSVLSKKSDNVDSVIKTLFELTSQIAFTPELLSEDDFNYLMEISRDNIADSSVSLSLVNSSSNIIRQTGTWDNFLKRIKDYKSTYNHKIISVTPLDDDLTYEMYSVTASINKYIPLSSGLIISNQY